MSSNNACPAQTSNRPTYSCIRCADRKVKCDRQKPCGPCVKHNADCVFRPPRPRKRHRRVEQLTDRLRHYEALLQEQGVEPEKLIPNQSKSTPEHTSRQDVAPASSSDGTQVQSPSSVDSELSSRLNKIQMVQGQGRSKYLEK